MLDGKSASIFTAHRIYTRDLCQGVDVKTRGINVAIPVPVGYHSLGGWKLSAFTDHGMHGPEGIQFYTKFKCGKQMVYRPSRRYPLFFTQNGVTS